MLQGRATIRLVAAMALALVVAAAIVPFAGSRALAQGPQGGNGENGQASITIYTAVCPAGFTGDDLFGECYDTPGANITYFLTAPGGGTPLSATTGANGFTAFEGLTVAGQYTLQIDVPGDFVDVAVRCSEDGNPFTITPGVQFGQFLLDLTTDNDIRCDFYILPDDQGVPQTGTLTVYKATCPVGYTGSDYFKDCFENATAGVTFFVTPQGGGTTLQDTTDANGFAGFTLSPNTYAVEEDIPGEFAKFFAYCTADGQVLETGISADGSRLAVDVGAGKDVRCDWYNIPFDLRGETPTAVPAQPTKAPVSMLPNTGAGSGSDGGAFWPLAGALALIGVAGVGLATGRARRAHAAARVLR